MVDISLGVKSTQENVGGKLTDNLDLSNVEMEEKDGGAEKLPSDRGNNQHAITGFGGSVASDTSTHGDGSLSAVFDEGEERDVGKRAAKTPDSSHKSSKSGVRFGTDQLRDFDVASTPSGSTVTPMKSGNPNAPRPQMSKIQDFDASLNMDPEETLFSVADLSDDEVIAPSLQLGSKPKSRSEDGKYISVRISLPESQENNPYSHDKKMREHVCQAVQSVLQSVQGIDPTAKFLHVYGDYDDSPYDDPNKVVSWTVLTQVLAFVSNPWVMHKSFSKKKKSTLSKNQRRQKRKAEKRRARRMEQEEGDGTNATGSGDEEDAPAQSNPLWLAMRLKATQEENFALLQGRANLDSGVSIFPKACQELHTKAEYALVMAHHSLCTTALAKGLAGCLMKQELTMFQQQGRNRKFFSETHDEDSGELS